MIFLIEENYNAKTFNVNDRDQMRFVSSYVSINSLLCVPSRSFEPWNAQDWWAKPPDFC